jgi:hypothetical protein
MYQLGHEFLTCDIAGAPPEYTVRADMWPSIHNYIIIIIANGSYMFPLQISHHQAVYVRGNYIPVVYI